MIKFSGMTKQPVIEDADYFPIIDSSETDPENQNQTVLFSVLKAYVMKDFAEAEAGRVQAEKERVATEQARVEAEIAREAKETGYVDQAKKWATYSTDEDVYGSDTNNAHYWSDIAKQLRDLAKIWAVGDSGTGVDVPSDSNNAYYYSEVARQYSAFNEPTFHIDYDNMDLIMDRKAGSDNLQFTLDEDKNLWFDLNV